jgi:hypothetical protein
MIGYYGFIGTEVDIHPSTTEFFYFWEENLSRPLMLGTIHLVWAKNNQKVTPQVIVQHVHLEIRALK